ncbi:TPA: Abi-alpha family protein [Yersinia enterocolitica]
MNVCDKLKYFGDQDILADLYVNLLAKAMSRDEAKLVHPAFLQVIQQLSPDEVLFIENMSREKIRWFCRDLSGNTVVDRDGIVNYVEYYNNDAIINERILEISIKPYDFISPEHTFLYIEHLHSLNIIKYTNDEHGVLKPINKDQNRHWVLELTDFGKLFHHVCVSRIKKGKDNE